MTSPQFAKVIVDAPLPELDYAVGDGVLPRVGDRVLVPLGARKVVGIVTGLADTTGGARRKDQIRLARLQRSEALAGRVA